MEFAQSVKDTLLSGQSFDFESLALEVFRYQAKQNPIYKEYLSYLKKSPSSIRRIEEIPFLPIDFFKGHQILCKGCKPQVIFQSSGTTGTERSKHFVCDPYFYQELSKKTFESFYGPIQDLHILALLPNYLEKGDSSLVFMVDHFIKAAQAPSGFFLDEINKLILLLQELKNEGKKVLLIGVTFALLDLAEHYSIDLSGITIMETGGMKGRRKEMLRSEVHQILQYSFNSNVIHSEYGMTELLSQAYSQEKEIFTGPNSLRILFREINDPFSIEQQKRNGGMNIVDLANIDSCSFIETKDIGGKGVNQYDFKVLGRFDNSDVRGCNLLVQTT
ncbi:acyl transferase [Algivirga pacifica]